MSGRLLFGTFTCTEECDAQEKKAEVNANPVERERFDTCDGNLKIILFTLKLLNKNVLQGVNFTNFNKLLFYTKVFCAYSLGFYFFSDRKLLKKLLIKCWFN